MSFLTDILFAAGSGFKREFKQSPWTVLAVLMMWGLAWAAYFTIYPSLAYSRDLEPIREKMTAIEIQTLDRDILSNLTQRCEAAKKGFLTARLQDLLREYQDKTGRSYPPLPSCEELR